MKLLLGLLTVWSVQGFAQVCSSVWVYKPYLSCGDSVAPNTGTTPIAEIGYFEMPSEKLKGGQDEQAVCRGVVAAYNAKPENRKAGLFGRLYVPDPVRSEPYYPNGLKINVKHIYYCAITVQQFPVVQSTSAACGSSERYSYQIGGAAPQDNAQCLSCDSLDGANINDLTVCLQNNIRDIINTRAVELREGDLAPVRQKVRQIQKINCSTPVASLQSLDQISLFMDFAGSVTCR